MLLREEPGNVKRPPEGDAKVVVAERNLRVANEIVKVPICVQELVLEVVIRTSVKGAGSGFGSQVEDGRAFAAVLCAVIVAQQADLLQRVHTGKHAQRRVFVMVEEVSAVEVITVGRVSLAVYRDAHRVIATRHCQWSASDGPSAPVHPGLQSDELDEVSLVQRKLRHFFLLDQRALCRVFQVEPGVYAARNHNLRIHRANLQDGIDRNRFVEIEDDNLHCCLEAGGLHGDLVGPDQKRRRIVAATGVGLHHARNDARGGIGKCYSRARNDCSRGIFHDPVDGTGQILGVHGRGQSCGENGDAQYL